MARRKMDPGVAALKRCYEALAPLNRHAQVAALNWLAARLAADQVRRYEDEMSDFKAAAEGEAKP